MDRKETLTGVDSIPHVFVEVETHSESLVIVSQANDGESVTRPVQEHLLSVFYRRLKYMMVVLIFTLGLNLYVNAHFQGRSVVRACMVSSVMLITISIIININLMVIYQNAKEDLRKRKLVMVLDVTGLILMCLSFLLSSVALILNL